MAEGERKRVREERKGGSNDIGEESGVDWGEVVRSVEENQLRHFPSLSPLRK